MSKMCPFSGILLLSAVLWSSEAMVELDPLEKVHCPADDHNTNTCYEMTEKNITCFNMFTCKPENRLDPFQDVGIGHGTVSSIPFLDTFLNMTRLVCNKMAKECTLAECKRKCCNGWTTDDYGRCSKRADNFNINCENGGTRTELDTCECRSGFGGRWCEEAICDGDGCQNGGTCVPVDGGNRCHCPKTYSGTNCEQKAECGVVCLNDGECITSDFKYACDCKNGYTGKNCAYKFDSKHCLPPNNTICLNHSCYDQCRSSDHCGQGLVCCNDGCCNSCMPSLADRVCWYGEHVLRPGETIRKDSCTECTCLWNGTLSCVKRTCSGRLPCSESDWVYPVGGCCPECKNDNLPSGYHPPILKNCPQSVTILNVPSYSSRVFVNGLGIRGYDFENRALEVKYQPYYLQHCKCSSIERNGDPVIATTEPDKYGRTGECRFSVIVIDRIPPTFLTCPDSIHARENEQVKWDLPRTYDNVGVRFLHVDPPGRGNDGYYTIGNHTITYTAVDYDGNRAFCQFSLFIYHKDTLPPGLSRRATANHKHISIIAGCLTVFFVAITVVLLFCFIRRWRHQRANNSGNRPSRRSRHNRQQDPPIPCVSNGMYDSGLVGVSNIHLKPPPYTPEMPPPAYEELTVTTGAAAMGFEQTEQPPKYEDIYYSYASVQNGHAYDNRGATDLGSDEGVEESSHSQRESERSADGGDQDQRPGERSADWDHGQRFHEPTQEPEYDYVQPMQRRNEPMRVIPDTRSRRETEI